MRFRNLLFIGFILLSPISVHSRPIEGFYNGPYILLVAGTKELDWDTNQRTQIQEGGSWEPLYGLTFGWNLMDWLAPELSLQYTNSPNGGRREHVAEANVGPTFSLLINPLLGETWQFIPFIHPTFTVELASLPGDRLAADDRVTMTGLGGSVTAGVRILRKYFYAGLNVRETFLDFDEQKQNINGVETLIYTGGMKTQFETFLSLGVHY